MEGLTENSVIISIVRQHPEKMGSNRLKYMLWIRSHYVVLSSTQPEYIYSLNQRVEEREAPLTIILKKKKKHWQNFSLPIQQPWTLLVWRLVPSGEVLLSRAWWLYWFGRWDHHLAMWESLCWTNRQGEKKSYSTDWSDWSQLPVRNWVAPTCRGQRKLFLEPRILPRPIVKVNGKL